MIKNHINHFDDNTQIYIFKDRILNLDAQPYVVYQITDGLMVDKIPILKRGTLKEEYGDMYEIIYHENEICEKELLDRKISYVKTSMQDFKDSFITLTRTKDYFK